jgi:hypothetical protein
VLERTAKANSTVEIEISSHLGEIRLTEKALTWVYLHLSILTVETEVSTVLGLRNLERLRNTINPKRLTNTINQHKT